MNFTLELLPDTLAICRLDADAPVPDWAKGEFVSITRTTDELSIVCGQDQVPDGVRCEAGWRCLRLVGQFNLSEIGVLAALTKSLAEANVSVFVIGTFATDYLLVGGDKLDSAVETLEAAGHVVGRA